MRDAGLEKKLDQLANDELKPRDLTDRVGEVQMERLQSLPLKTREIAQFLKGRSQYMFSMHNYIGHQ